MLCYHGSKILDHSLSNDDGDGEKANKFREQNNTFARAPRFFVHFLAVVARLRRETS